MRQPEQPWRLEMGRSWTRGGKITKKNIPRIWLSLLQLLSLPYEATEGSRKKGGQRTGDERSRHPRCRRAYVVITGAAYVICALHEELRKVARARSGSLRDYTEMKFNWLTAIARNNSISRMESLVSVVLLSQVACRSFLTLWHATHAEISQI